ncbi:MAG: acetyl-CoA hydrolase/transferase family protein [Candidatus Saccharibacteria bacterium]
MNVKEMYKSKLKSAEEAAKLINSHDKVVVPLSHGIPQALMQALAKRNDIENVTVSGGLDIHMLDIYNCEAMKGKINIDSLYVGPVLRNSLATGGVTYSAIRLFQGPKICRTHRPYEIAALTVSPMDKHGWFSMGTDPDYIHSVARAPSIHTRILEVNHCMPRVLGDTMIHISEVDAVVENDTPLLELPPLPASDEDVTIAGFIADMVEDGSCLQLGIGGLPSILAGYLEHKKDLGVHSEMLCDTFVDLYNKGAISGKNKSFRPGRWVGTFALGSRKLYDFIDDNPLVEMMPCDVVNDPCVIGMNDKVVAVNQAIEIDLTGQCCSESIGPRHYSGTGGQLDFVEGAWRSNGGKAFIAIYSTYTDKENKTHSRITPTLTPGATVTTPRGDMQYVVTEYGIADIKGQSLRERAKRLIAIAHPDFRDELRFQARKLNLIS